MYIMNYYSAIRKIEIMPFAFRIGKHALRAKDHAVILGICELLEDIVKGILLVAANGLAAEAREHLIRVMMMMMVMSFMVMIMAVAFLTVLVMMMVMFMLVLIVVIVVMMVMMLMLVVIVVMMVMMLVLIVVMMVMVVMLMLVLIVIIVMVVMVALTLVVIVIIVMVSAYRADILFLKQLLGKVNLGFHRLEDLFARQFIPGSRDDRRVRIFLAKKLHACLQLILGNELAAAQQDRVCALYLVVEELAEVLHVDAALACVNNGYKAGDDHLRVPDALNRANNVGKFADTRGLDEDAVRMELLLHLHERLAEISDKRAADAARVHLGDLDAGVLQKTAVNTDLAELIFNQNHFLALISVSEKFLDERRLAGAQKSGKYCYLNHVHILLAA